MSVVTKEVTIDATTLRTGMKMIEDLSTLYQRGRNILGEFRQGRRIDMRIIIILQDKMTLVLGGKRDKRGNRGKRGKRGKRGNRGSIVLVRLSTALDKGNDSKSTVQGSKIADQDRDSEAHLLLASPVPSQTTPASAVVSSKTTISSDLIFYIHFPTKLYRPKTQIITSLL